MKKHFFTDCPAVMDSMYESEKDEPLPVLRRIQLGLHLFICPGCAEAMRNFRRVEEIMKADFFPLAPDFGDLLMERLYKDNSIKMETDAPAGFSFRFWVIAGFFVLLSLSSSFFGMNFIEIADAEGLSFLLPVGITIGMVVTCYGALFIGSHLKELSSRFRLH
jgi:hypothetical protein